MLHVNNPVRGGFTLVELLVAMAIALFILNTAFVAINYTRKCIRKAETLGVQAAVIQSQVLWTMTQRSVDAYPPEVQDRGVASAFSQGPMVLKKKYVVGDFASSGGVKPIRLDVGWQGLYSVSSSGASSLKPEVGTGEWVGHVKIGGDNFEPNGGPWSAGGILAKEALAQYLINHGGSAIMTPEGYKESYLINRLPSGIITSQESTSTRSVIYVPAL